MQKVFSNAVRRLGRIGIVSTLLCASLLAVVVAVVVVQGWTLHIITEFGERTAQAQLDTNLAVLKQEMLHLGADWRLGDDGKLTLNGKAAEGLDQVVDDVARITQGVATIFAGDTRIATNVRKPDGSRAIGTKLAAGPAREAVITNRNAFRGPADILGKRYLTVYEPWRDADGRQVGILFVGVSTAAVQAMLSDIMWQASLAALLVVLIVGVSTWLMLRFTLRPLRALADAVRTISNGRLDVPAPCADRTDQLGEIGRALEMLRGKARQAQALEAQAAANQEAKSRRQEAMDELNQNFGKSLSGVLAGLMSSATDMHEAAADMARAAERTRGDMTATTSDAEASSQNLSRVAAAAEQLTVSVSEISRQVDEASQSAQKAVGQARVTDERVRGLSEAAGQIGKVVSLISDIAARTNLLALNATIEAARAGEAGKGFAIVAGEVKQLASQTARATTQIGLQVGAIQAATGEAADAVTGVAEAIMRVSHAATTIAVAVEQQGAATREIAQQVNIVADATTKAARAMSDVSGTAEKSSETSRAVVASADQVTRISATLRGEVDHFMSAMRQNQGSDERRKYERMPGGDAVADLRSDAHGAASCRIIDISLGGAALLCDWPCEAGTEIMLRLPGGGAEAPARAVGARGDKLGVSFRQDPATLSEVGKAVEWITARNAARPLAA